MSEQMKVNEAVQPATNGSAPPTQRTVSNPREVLGVVSTFVPRALIRPAVTVQEVPGGAKRLRALLSAFGGNFQGADKVGTLHDMRFVFLDDDTKLLFATAYDGEWDAYIDDFVAKIPDYLDIISSAFLDWPGIRSPAAKDYFLKYQITAAGWYVANPDLTVVETRRLKRVGEAVQEFLDKVGD